MAHELAFENGVAQCFSASGLTPWHREGIVLAGTPAYQEALRLVKFDYPMEKRPYHRPMPDGTYVESQEAFYIYRPDTDKVLGTVGSQYEIVTNEEAFNPLEPLVDAGLLKLETGGVLRDGADAWLLGQWDMAKFGDTARAVFEGEVVPYCTVMANHSGRRGILMGQTPIRIVCANTLGQAEASGQSRWLNIDHRTGAKVRLVEAANELFGRIRERYEVIAQQYRLLMQTALTQEQFRRMVLDLVVPDPRQKKGWNPEAKLAEVVVARADDKRRHLTHLWAHGKGHTGEQTAYFAYNAVCEALDHNRELWPTRAGCYRTASLLTGELAQAKNRALDRLVEYAMSA